MRRRVEERKRSVEEEVDWETRAMERLTTSVA